jgi:TatD DNase family protein
MPPPLVDYHCHLDLYSDHEQMFAECAREGVEILAVTTTPRAWARNKQLASTCPSIRVGLGLHPQLIADGHNEIELFEQLLGGTRYVGEIGLDAGPRDFKSFERQRSLFERILVKCAEHGDKILSIHAVRATREVLALLESCLPANRGKAVLHWFGGSKAEAKRASEIGCYFSINGEMLKTDNRREVVASLPIEQILTETDGPFTMIQNRPAKPPDIAGTVAALATLLKLDAAELRSRISANLRNLEAG